jgi:hypothetical protein
MRRLRAPDRRGTVPALLRLIIDALVIAVLILIAVGFGYKVWKALYGPDKASYNAYNLMVDTSNSLLRSPSPNTERMFLFTFNKERHFEGTIFAISSNGTVSGAFAPKKERYTFDDVPELRDPAKFKPSMVDSACAKSACLCYSKLNLEPTADSAAKLQLLLKPYKCRSLQPMPESAKTLSAEIYWGFYAEGSGYNNVKVLRKTDGGVTAIKIMMQSPKST